MLRIWSPWRGLKRAWAWLARAAVWPNTVMEWLQILGGAAVILGGVVGFLEYREARAELRVTRTLELVARFDDEALAKAQEDVSAIGADAAKAIAALPEDPELKGGARELKVRTDEAIVDAAYRRSGNQGELSPSVRKVVGFFEGVQICIERRVCDETTAHAYFDDYASAFWLSFEPLVRHEQTNLRPQFGRRMQQFVDAGRRPA